LTSKIYSAATQISASPNAFTYSTNNANIAAVGSAKLNKVTYSHVVQENGYGKARFEIVLPRQPARDMKLEVLGSLSALKIASEEPRCVATFSETGTYGKNWDQGDILIDICSVKKFETSPPIVVTTKKMIYKCGITFQKTLYIDVWPIKVYNWNATGANKSFTVDMKTKGGEAIAKNSTPADLTMAATSAAVTTTQSETLCPVTKITPSIPGLPGDYTFTFDLETNKAALDNATVDEVSIFFPYKYYGSFINNIICKKGSDILNCTFSEEGILNIRVTLNAGAKEAITLLGVPNPYIASDYSFVCTVNNSNVQTGVRTNLITGSGKLSGGITSTAVTQSGGLRFLKVSNPVNPGNIRSTSTHIFRVAFDKAIALTSIDKITVSNTPCIFVFLPQEYLLAYYTNTVPTVEITQYNKDNENKITPATTPVALGAITVSGNIIKVQLEATSYEFDTNFMYWDIKISNLMNPAEVTELTGPPATMTTCMYQVVLTNSDNTACYRTMSNLNTYATDKLKTAFDSNLAYNRGNKFAEDPTKFTIDIFSDINQMNLLTIKAGRYLKSYMKMRVRSNESEKLRPALSVVTLNNYASFKMLESAGITVASAFNEKISFWIGCPCNTAGGRYIISFTQTETLEGTEQSKVAAMAPVVITVDRSTFGTVSYKGVTNIPGAGSTIIQILLTEPNFEAMNLTFTAQENITNDKSASISNLVVPEKTVTSGTAARNVYTTFSITDVNILAEQKYQIAQDNLCYKWDTNDAKKKINFVIDQKTAIIPEKIDLTTYFTYTNSVTETSLMKNQMKFKFTAPAAPIYLYCALVCSDITMPAFSVIKENTLSNVDKNSITEKYYFGMVANKETPIEFTFSNLARGLKYAMNCTIESTQGEITLRTKSTSSVYDKNGNTTTNFVSPTDTNYRCARWNFNNNPGVETKVEIVRYCQRLFSEPGYFQNGCVVCADSEDKYVSKGLTLSKQVACAPATNKTRRLRFLAESSTVDDASFFTVCATPNPVCETDSKYTEIFEKFRDSLKTNKDFQDTLKVTNVFVNETNPVVDIKGDTTPPSVDNIDISVLEANPDGTFKVEISNPTALKCFYKVQTGSAPSFEELKACSDKSRCGTVRIGSAKKTFELEEKVAFTPGDYKMFYSCQNDISNAEKYTTVASGGAAFNIPDPNAGDDNSTSTSTSTEVSAGFIGYSMMGLMMIVALLF